MIRAEIHNVLDKVWLEVSQLQDRHGTKTWVSIGRMMLGDLEEVVSVTDAVEELSEGLVSLRENLRGTWDRLEAHQF